jgi:hypothetical protein
MGIQIHPFILPSFFLFGLKPLSIFLQAVQHFQLPNNEKRKYADFQNAYCKSDD